MTDPNERQYDQTRDPRTGRPPLPADAERIKEKRRNQPEELRTQEEESAPTEHEGIGEETPQLMGEAAVEDESAIEEIEVPQEDDPAETAAQDASDEVEFEHTDQR